MLYIIFYNFLQLFINRSDIIIKKTMGEEKLIRNTNGISQEETNLLREKFISEYSTKKGWNKSSLSPDQMLEIIEQKEYKNPLMILG